ncbi:MAG: substrate-binding domain-containing protein, partial [Clostridia bacterium]|nr:substrate-binding domain-containing protein [Clostridia bacterium]
MKIRWVIALLGLIFVTACAPAPVEKGDDKPPQDTQKTFALVVKSLENPYMTTMYDGFRTACDEIGAIALLMGPGPAGMPDQSDVLSDLIEKRVSAIAIAANDMDEVSPMLQKARYAGLPVVSLDSMVKVDERVVHIQQTSPEVIGRVLIQAAAVML